MFVEIVDSKDDWHFSLMGPAANVCNRLLKVVDDNDNEDFELPQVI